MVHNVLENAVQAALEDYLANGYDGCTCEQCKHDIMAYTLNQLQPLYSSTQKGEAFFRVKLMNDQMKIDIFRQIAASAEVVKKNQHRHLNYQ